VSTGVSCRAPGTPCSLDRHPCPLDRHPCPLDRHPWTKIRHGLHSTNHPTTEVTVKNARKALVLGGGGITGIGWELGVLAGLRDHGVDLTSADVVVGTSAGSVVGAQLTSGESIEKLYDQQLQDATDETAAALGLGFTVRWVLANVLPGGDLRARTRVGKLALAAKTEPESSRREVFAKLLADADWPSRNLQVTAVEAATGEVAVFDRDSGVPLVDAVAASCAVPMVWPPMTINGRRYMDGGARSGTNADLATDCGRVVVLAPMPLALRRSGRISEQLARLGPKVHSFVICPDENARKAIGRNILDPAARAASARAGRAQAASIRDRVAVVWGHPPA
jgi:NTE family protein